MFLHLLDKHFGRNNKYHKIFNRNSVKISNSCMNNIKNIIRSRNKGITHFYNEINGETCNCRNKNNCPLDNKCRKLLKLTDKIVLKAEVETNDGIKELSRKVYFGISDTEFKFKYNNHTISFRNRTHENDSKLSKFIWSLKDQNKEFEENFWIKIAHPLPFVKASNKQFQREGEVTQQVIKSCVEMQA